MEKIAIKIQNEIVDSDYEYEMSIMLDGSGELGSTIRNSIDKKIKKFIIDELKKENIKLEDFFDYVIAESKKTRELEESVKSDSDMPFHPVHFPSLYSDIYELFEEESEIEY